MTRVLCHSSLVELALQTRKQLVMSLVWDARIHTYAYHVLLCMYCYNRDQDLSPEQLFSLKSLLQSVVLCNDSHLNKDSSSGKPLAL